jgi:hypothetical protein
MTQPRISSEEKQRQKKKRTYDANPRQGIEKQNCDCMKLQGNRISRFVRTALPFNIIGCKESAT